MITTDPMNEPVQAAPWQPTTASTRSDLPNLAEHGCYLFYPVRLKAEFDKDLNRTLGDLLPSAARTGESDAASWVPADTRSTLVGERLGQKVWQPAAIEIGSDLHPHIRRLLGAEGGDGEAAGARAYRLTDPARRLLSGQLLSYPREMPADQRRPKSLELDLRSVAVKRIANRLGAEPGCTLYLDVAELRLVRFRTSHAILLAELTFRRSDGKPLHPCWVVEAIHGLARVHTLRWRMHDKTVLQDPAEFTFVDIVRSLAGDVQSRERARRVFTATYARFDEAADPSAVQRLAVQLSRHYTDDYRMREALPGIELVSDFENVLHAFALEGCATLVNASPANDGRTVDFLRTYKTQTYESHYLPIILLVFHEFMTLVHLSNDSSFWPELERRNGDPLARLEDLRDRFLKFRLCYRLSHVSHISMHNATNRALRKVLDLDAMAEDLRRDTAEIDAFLREAAAKRTEERFRWGSIIGGAGLAWLTTFTIFKEIGEALLLSHRIPPPGIAAVGIVAAAALFVGGVAGWVIWSSLRTPHASRRDETSHLAEHAVHEILIERALKNGPVLNEPHGS
jgi:hypothetical protein